MPRTGKKTTFITEVLDGRPYQAFVPLRMAPAPSQGWNKTFVALEKSLQARSSDEEFREMCLRSISQPQNRSKPDRQDRHSAVERAFDTAVAYSTLDRQRLTELNSILVENASIGLRRQAAWLGGSHPATSWHVGSPARELPRLVNIILASSKNHESRLFGALVCLVRLLQVHPYSDGNGRTARLYFCWLVMKGIGPSVEMVRILDSLWRRSEFDLHGACVEIRDEDNWQPLFERCLQVAGDFDRS